jgi:heme-degrading monooxygenase HmoA
VTIVEFASEEANRAWRMHPEHREAQRKAREVFYERYSVQVCEVKRAAKLERAATAATAK